jgi:EmrB/QacA subfamily drug resistance transporter
MSEPDPRRWYILTAMALCMFIATVDNTVMTVGLATIQDQLDASNAELQWSMDAYTLTFAALLFTAGLLGDRLGRRRVLLAGLTLFLVTSVAGAFSGDPTQLIAWRALMGVGAAVIPGCTMAVIATVFPAEERARAIGLWSTSAGIGIAVGPVLGGGLLGAFDWGSLLLVNVPFVVVAMAMIVVLVPANQAPVERHFDVIGVLLSIAGVGSLVYGIIAGGEHSSWLVAEVLGPIALGIVLICALVVYERRAAYPSVDVALFRDRLFAVGSVVLAVSFFVGTGGTFVLSLYLQQLRDFTPIQAGLLMLPLAAGAMVAGARAAQLVGRLGRSRALGLCGAGMAVSCAGFAVMDADTTLVLFEPALGVLGLSFGGAFAIGMASAMSVVPPARVGAGSAVANTVRHMGTALGIAVLGSVLASAYQAAMSDSSHGLAHGAVTSLGSTLQAVAALAPAERAGVLADAQSAFVSGLHSAMWVSAGLGLLAGVLALVSLRPRPVAAPAEPAAAVN